MYALPTAFTFFEWIRFVLSQMNGTAGAWAVIILSMLAPRLVALVTLEDRGLVHRLVDLRVVELRQVVVAAVRLRVRALEHRLEHRLRVVEVLEPTRGAADGDLLGRLLAPLGVDRVLRHRAETDLEAELLELGLGDLGLGLARVDVGA